MKKFSLLLIALFSLFFFPTSASADGAANISGYLAAGGVDSYTVTVPGGVLTRIWVQALDLNGNSEHADIDCFIGVRGGPMIDKDEDHTNLCLLDVRPPRTMQLILVVHNASTRTVSYHAWSE